MQQHPFLPTHPLYRIWLLGNAISISNKNRTRSSILSDKVFAEASYEDLPPRINAIMIKGLISCLMHSYQRLTRDVQSLLRQIENPKISAEKAARANQAGRRLMNLKTGKNILTYSDSMSGSGNKYRFAFTNKSHIDDPSEITLPNNKLNLSNRFENFNESFAFLDANNTDFQSILNNYFPGQNPLEHIGLYGDQLGPNGLDLNIDINPYEALKLNFGLKGDYLTSFTQRMNNNYKNFLMITPAKLKNKDYFEYDEDKSSTREKPSEDKRDKRRVNFVDRGPEISDITRSLNFGGERKREDHIKRLLEPCDQEDYSVEAVSGRLKRPAKEMGPELMDIWNFAIGKNNDVFDKNIAKLNQKEELLMNNRNKIENIEVARQRNDSSHFHSSVDKLSEKLLSQPVSLHSVAKSANQSSVKGLSFLDDENFTVNYDAIEEATNEFTCTTQFFGVSESHMNPPSHSYEMSLNQFFNIKNVEEKKLNQQRKELVLPKETKNYLSILVERAKVTPEIKFDHLVADLSKEDKVSFFYNTLVLASTDQIVVKQKIRQSFGEITIKDSSAVYYSM